MVLIEPSIIDSKPYKFIRNFEECELLEMPETLIEWLLIKNDTSEIIKMPKTKLNSPTTNININDTPLEKILYLLPSKYVDDYIEWLYILTVCKNLDKWDIFDKWSSQSSKYNFKYVIY